ncbi:diguanylate cyclase (GGDEF) domain-containing protein [Klenkia marina]|uniref:Diguanylate cyclase (GGDEF) domain-containing protein n=1 Tax=Klenkia marina TaxID=1960309 RepID=A0A1G4YNX6_9ACTN|nr:diguanylate cyclase [Klenkia marina]SCX55054.1 diguanylate cyclase (GGDEF) domain-containing protein [Klenkia marina]
MTRGAPSSPAPVRSVAFALLLAAAVLLGRWAVVPGTGVNLVWPAAGVAALWLLVQHGRRTALLDAVLLVGVVVVVDVATGMGAVAAVALGLVNLGQAALFGSAFRRLAAPGRPGPLLLDMRDLTALLVSAGLASTVAAVAGTLVLQLVEGGASVGAALVWQARNGAAILVLVALGLRVRQLLLSRRGVEHPDLLPFQVPRGWRAVELGLAVVASVLGNLGVFLWMPQYPIAFPLFALTAWVALRFDTGLTALRTLAVGVVAVVFTVQGHGPFAAVDDVLARAGIVQAYVVIGAVLGLALSLTRDQRLVLTARLRAAAAYSEERHRQVRVLAQASRTVLLADDPRAAVCAAVREAVGADGVYLLEPDPDGRLTSTAAVGMDLPPLSFDLDPPTSLTARLFHQATPHFSADVTTEPGVSPAVVDDLGVVSAAWQPAVLVDDRVVAVIGVFWRVPVPDLCDTTLGILSVLGTEAARAIERGNLLEQLARAADRDQLTGLANRRRWDELSTVEVSRAQRTGLPLTFLLLDLDHFKVFNDTHGHQAGDVLLREFGAAAGGCLRDGDLIARWGGEEFAVALPGCSADQALVVAARIIAAVPLGQSATVGVAEWVRGESAAQTLCRADTALYEGKRGGRARAVLAGQPGVVVPS